MSALRDPKLQRTSFKRQSRQKNRMHGLDFLRFVLAFSVLLFHYFYHGPTSGHVSTPVAHEQIYWLQFAVMTFFVISGFVIFYSMQGRSPFEFAYARVLRLWPALAICSALTILTISVFESYSISSWMAWLRATLLFPLTLSMPYLDNSYWSLTYELRFYAFITIVLLAKTGRHALFCLTVLGVIELLYVLLSSVSLVLGFPYTALFALGMSLAANWNSSSFQSLMISLVNLNVASFCLALQIFFDTRKPEQIDDMFMALVGAYSITLISVLIVLHQPPGRLKRNMWLLPAF